MPEKSESTGRTNQKLGIVTAETRHGPGSVLKPKRNPGAQTSSTKPVGDYCRA